MSPVVGAPHPSKNTFYLKKPLKKLYTLLQNKLYTLLQNHCTHWPEYSVEEDNKYLIWKRTIEQIEKAYIELIKLGASPQEARSILPNSLKTEIVMTMNLREWKHFFSLRTPETAHPQMREIAVPLLKEFQKRIPIIFDDIPC